MAYTQADLDALDLAIAAAGKGQRVTDVQNGDRRVKYADASLADMLALRDRMAREIPAVAVGGVRPARAFRGFLSSGY
jgi:hypothetical protein